MHSSHDESARPHAGPLAAEAGPAPTSPALISALSGSSWHATEIEADVLGTRSTRGHHRPSLGGGSGLRANRWVWTTDTPALDSHGQSAALLRTLSGKPGPRVPGAPGATAQGQAPGLRTLGPSCSR